MKIETFHYKVYLNLNKRKNIFTVTEFFYSILLNFEGFPKVLVSSANDMTPDET